jgi:hypothetical protein
VLAAATHLATVLSCSVALWPTAAAAAEPVPIQIVVKMQQSAALPMNTALGQSACHACQALTALHWAVRSLHYAYNQATGVRPTLLLIYVNVITKMHVLVLLILQAQLLHRNTAHKAIKGHVSDLLYVFYSTVVDLLAIAL